eukprot:631642-Pelagomonas_calceolata.AAC.3
MEALPEIKPARVLWPCTPVSLRMTPYNTIRLAAGKNAGCCCAPHLQPHCRRGAPAAAADKRLGAAIRRRRDPENQHRAAPHVLALNLDQYLYGKYIASPESNAGFVGGQGECALGERALGSGNVATAFNAPRFERAELSASLAVSFETGSIQQSLLGQITCLEGSPTEGPNSATLGGSVTGKFS